MQTIRCARRMAVTGTIAAAVLALTCQFGPVDWNSTSERTIRENLAAVDSAGRAYASHLPGGNTDAAAQAALSVLLASPGVDTALIAPDSTVWAVFTNGLLAGTGDLSYAASESVAAIPPAEAAARALGGGEVGQYVYAVTPHEVTLPGTRTEARAIGNILSKVMCWDSAETFKNADVTVDVARGILATGTRVLLWAGHGTTAPRPDSGWYSAICTGATYATRDMARAAATTFRDDLTPTGGDRRCGLFQSAPDNRWWTILLPDFFRTYADFDQAEPMPFNQTKTLVVLACCYSAYGSSGSRPNDLIQALLAQGADVVYGYDWAVNDGWACDRDIMLFSSMATEYTANEAMRRSNNTDPNTVRGGHATLRFFGDTLVLLQNIMSLYKDDSMFRAATSSSAARGERSGVMSCVRYQKDFLESDPDVRALISIGFPGSAPGQFNTTVDDDALVSWSDMKEGRTYYAQKGFVGVGCQINVTRCTPDAIYGDLAGTVGYWEPPNDPTRVPPTKTISLTQGKFKYTGKIGTGGM